MDSLDVEAWSIEKEELSNSGMVGYTLCGDSIDKNVRRRYQRSDRITISLHHFHMYANRVDFTSESDDCLYSNLSVDDKACFFPPRLKIKKRRLARIAAEENYYLQRTYGIVQIWIYRYGVYVQYSPKMRPKEMRWLTS